MLPPRPLTPGMRATSRRASAILALLVIACLVGIFYFGFSDSQTTGSPAELDPVTVHRPPVHEVEASARSVSKAGPSADPLTPMLGLCELQFREVGTSQIAVAANWRIVSRDDPSVHFDSASDRDGRLTVEPGSWRIEALDPAFVLTKKDISIDVSEARILWVQRKAVIHVHVMDARRMPVPDAAVRWAVRPYREGYDPHEDWSHLEYAGVLLTDSEGSATLVDAPTAGLVLLVSAPDRKPRVVLIDRATTGEVDVVLSEPDSSAFVITVVDRQTLLGISDVECLSPTGPVAATKSDLTGELQVPSWLRDGSPVRFRARGYCDGFVAAKELSPGTTVTLVPECLLHVSLVDESGSPLNAVQVVCNLADESMSDGAQGAQPIIESGPWISAQGTVDCRVPVRIAIELLARDDLGRSARAIIVAERARARATLRLTSEGSLNVQLNSESGQPVADARLEVVTRSGLHQELRANELGVALIPMPQLVALVRIRALGFVEAVLEPRQVRGQEFQGGVAIELRRERALAIELVDDSSRPCRGIELHILASRDQPSTVGDPELQGCLPTNHPSWVRQPRPLVRATTDASGRATVHGLEEGISGSCRFELPSWSRTDTVVPSSYSRYVGERFIPPTGANLRWVLASMKAVSLDVFNGADRTPLNGVDLWSSDRLLRLLRHAPSSIDIWMPTGEGSLIVTKTGFEESRVDIVDTALSGERIVVLVWPGETASIQFEGEIGDLGGRLLRVHAWPPGATLGKGLPPSQELWSGEVRIDAAAMARIYVPVADRAVLSLEPLHVGEGVLEFVPLEQSWSPGGSLRFRVVRR